MNISVCGGEGMIGRNVIHALLSRGIPGLAVFKADIKQGSDLKIPEVCFEAVGGMDAVYHLADRTVGIGYSSTHHGQMMTDSLLISLNLLEASRKAGVKDYLYVSSSCVYNSMIERAEESRTHYFNPKGLISYADEPESANEGYGWAKRIAERQCVYYAKEYGMRTVIVRPANIYGPSYDWSRPVEDMHVIPALICKMLRGDPEIVVWGSGNQTRTFQYEADCARLIVDLMGKGLSGQAYNLGGTEMAIDGVIALLSSLCGYKGRLRFDRSKPEGPTRKAQDTSKLDALLGCNPNNRPLNDGLRATVEAARKDLACSA